MNEFVRILKTLKAYLMRPDLYPELGRKIVKNSIHRNRAFKGKEEAKRWLESNAISTEEFTDTHNTNQEYESFRVLYPLLYQEAEKRQNQSPVQMGGAGNLDLLYYLSEYTQATSILETGVAYGWSSLAFLQSLQKRNGTLYSSDMPYLAQNADQYVGVVVPESLKNNWKLYRYADRESLPKIFDEQQAFDIVHYDSDKSYDGMMWAYNQLYPKVKKGGYFISDDINDNGAFMDFCKQNNLNPYILFFEDKFIGIIPKD